MAEVRFRVRLTPRGSRDEIDGVVDGVLHLRVSAPPVGGAANGALIRLIARELGVSRTSVRLVAGAAGRQKVVAIDGLTPDDVHVRWPDLQL